MFVILNPHLFHPALLDYLYPESKFIQPEVSTKWMFVSSPNIDTQRTNYDYINDDRHSVCIVLFGRIHNMNELRQVSNSPFSTEMETVIHLYLTYGMEQTARRLEGDYTMMLLDYNINHPCSVFYVLQNHLGTRPLYYGVLTNASSSSLNIYDTFIFSENASYLEPIREKYSNLEIRSVPCGTYMEYHLAFGASPKWKYHSQHTYYTLPISPYLGKQMDETIPEQDLQTLRLLYNTLYSWMERWMREQYEWKRSFVLLDTGDVESKLILAICKRICLLEEWSEPPIYRVSLLPTSEQNVVVVSPDELKEIVDNMDEMGMVRKWISPYLATKQIMEENKNKGGGDFVGNILCSSYLDITQWENEKYNYEDLLEMETAWYKQLQGVLPKYIQTINAVSDYIQCITPLFQRSCVDILFRISAETRFQWATKSICWIQIMLSMAYSPFDSEMKLLEMEQTEQTIDKWWNEYGHEQEQEKEKEKHERMGNNN